MAFSPDSPFNDLPNLPPSSEIETKEVLRKVAPARAALAALAESLSHLPNAEIITNSIILQEAKDSSEIENIITTHDELFKALVMQSNLFENTSTKEVIRYREALRVGFESLGNRGVINTPLIDLINKALLNHDAGIRRTPGTKLLNDRTKEVVYTPPEGRSILETKLDHLWRYLQEKTDQSFDPLINLALFHYQFEAIHPYSDGNGRTGRILNVLYLVQQNLLPLPVLYMSGYIIRTKPQYYELLRAVTAEERWKEWILYILGAVEETANSTRQLVAQIRDMRKGFDRVIKSRAPHIKQIHEVTEILFTQPYSRIEFFVDRKIGSRKTISSYLKILEELELVESHRISQHTVFINQPLLKLLSDHRIG
jgi:Fic family protein